MASYSQFTPCRLTTAYWSLCGDRADGRICYNLARLYDGGVLQDKATCCDKSCRTIRAPTAIIKHVKCDWCESYPQVPRTNWVPHVPLRQEFSGYELDQMLSHFYNNREQELREDQIRLDAEKREIEQLEQESKARKAARRALRRSERQAAWAYRVRRERSAMLQSREVPLHEQNVYFEFNENLVLQHYHPSSAQKCFNNDACPICRKSLTAHPYDARKLPCDHAYHYHCIRTWFQPQNGRPKCIFCYTKYNVREMPDFDDPDAYVEAPVSPPLERGVFMHETVGGWGI